MSERTPSEDDLRAAYIDRKDFEAQVKGIERPTDDMSGFEFDRAIDKVRADAKVEALREVADLLAPKGILWWGDSGVRVSDGPFGLPQGSLDDWLRARADNLEAS